MNDGRSDFCSRTGKGMNKSHFQEEDIYVLMFEFVSVSIICLYVCMYAFWREEDGGVEGLGGTFSVKVGNNS